MEYSLLNPNQLRYAGLDVWDNPFDTEWKLEIVGENESEDQRIVIPIHMKGTILYFDTSTPTQSNLDTLAHFHLTLENEWNPHEVRLLRNVASTSQSVEEDRYANQTLTKKLNELWKHPLLKTIPSIKHLLKEGEDAIQRKPHHQKQQWVVRVEAAVQRYSSMRESTVYHQEREGMRRYLNQFRT
jgi:hypothetical protein